MTLSRPASYSSPTTGRSGVFRQKALFCQQQAREATDPASRQGWEELAAEWQKMSDSAANGENSLIEVA
jgi:hypothetical protein